MLLRAVGCVTAAGQYLIGYLAGKSVRVQRFVAVDRVFTRAMELILTPALNRWEVSYYTVLHYTLCNATT